MRALGAAILSATIGLGGVMAGSADAALLAYEGFNYAAGSNLTGQTGGQGFSSAWSGTTIGDVTPTSSYVIGNGNLANSAYPVSQAVGNKASSGLADNGPTAVVRNIHRTLSTPLDLDTVGNVYYFSFLVHKSVTTVDGLGTGERAYLRLGNMGLATDGVTPAWSAKLDMGIGDNGRYFLAGAFFPPELNTSYYVADETLRIVGTISVGGGTSSSLDRVRLKIYRPGDELDAEEPTTWIRNVGNLNLTGQAADLRLSGGNMGDATFDEIRIGTTWADMVSPVPEPGVGLLAGLTGLALVRRRRAR